MALELIGSRLGLGRGAGSVLIARCLSVLIAGIFAHLSRRNLSGDLRCLGRGLSCNLLGFGSSLHLGSGTSGTLLSSALLGGASGRLLTCLLLGGGTGGFLGFALLVDLRSHRDDSGKMAGDGAWARYLVG